MAQRLALADWDASTGLGPAEDGATTCELVGLDGKTAASGSHCPRAAAPPRGREEASEDRPSRARPRVALSGAMIRRTARLRREFIYRKSLEGKERELYEKKRKIRQCLEEGKVIPTELRNAESSLRQEIALEDASTAANGANADDEYARANERDPKVLVTTSRDPSSRLTQFVKEIKLLMPTAQRINRGAQVLPDLVELCRSNDFTDLVMVHEHRGEPDGLVISHMPFGPTGVLWLVQHGDAARHQGRGHRTRVGGEPAHHPGKLHHAAREANGDDPQTPVPGAEGREEQDG